MKGQATLFGRFAASLNQAASLTGNGASIDCLGYDEALAVVSYGQLAGTTPSSVVHWEESADGSSWANITGAVHKAALVDDNDIVASVNLTNTTLTIAAQPANPSRLLITVTDTTPGITAGTVTITGTRPPSFNEFEDQEYTEAVTFTAGAAKRTTGVFKTITSIVTSGFTVLGGGGDETVKIGSDNSNLVHEGSINLINRKRYLRAVNTESGSGVSGAVCAGLFLLSASYRPLNRAIAPEFRID